MAGSGGGWIGVDLDGVLAEYHEGQSLGVIGPPIRPMIERVKGWLAEGKEVRIFTARIGPVSAEAAIGALAACHITAGPLPVLDWENFQRTLIEAWSLEYLGQILPITATKDYRMISLWDDRCVQMETNTGRTIQERVEDLEGKIRHLLEVFELYGPDGVFTFPDGESWERT